MLCYVNFSHQCSGTIDDAAATRSVVGRRAAVQLLLDDSEQLGFEQLDGEQPGARRALRLGRFGEDEVPVGI